MKKKELAQLKQKSIAELRSFIADKQKEKTARLMETKIGKVKNVHIVSAIKKDIAKVMTILTTKIFTKDKEKTNAPS